MWADRETGEKEWVEGLEVCGLSPVARHKEFGMESPQGTGDCRFDVECGCTRRPLNLEAQIELEILESVDGSN